MHREFKKEDLRIIKTRKAIYNAFLALLNRQPFGKITVNDICKEAMVSKTAFYAHFKDKYDLLEHWLAEQRDKLKEVFRNNKSQMVENILYETLKTYSAVIVNLSENVDQEQRDLLYRFLAPDTDSAHNKHFALLADFLAGGLYRIVFCQMKDRQKSIEEDWRRTSSYMYRLINAILSWDELHSANHGHGEKIALRQRED